MKTYKKIRAPKETKKRIKKEIFGEGGKGK